MRIPFLASRKELRTALYAISEASERLIELFGGLRKTKTGIEVTEMRAMQATAIYASVRAIAEGTAQLPLHLYRRLPGGGKMRAVDHYLYSILHDMPNPEMSAYEFREALTGNAALRGNGYAEIEWNNAGQIVALWPLRPDRVTVYRDLETWDLYYNVMLPDLSTATLPARNILHLRGFGENGLVGFNPIHIAREAVGLALATEDFGASFFGNGAQVGGVVTAPGALSDKAYKRMEESMNKKHVGLDKAHRLMLLEEGVQYTRIGIPPEDAQFLETRQFQVKEIARLFKVPPHIIGDLDRSTNNNIEQQSMEFVAYSLGPWLIRWEQAVYRSLLGADQRQTLFAEHMVDALLRGDIKARYEAYNIGRQGGWLSGDDIREMENLNPMPDGAGKIYLVNGNMVPVDQAGVEQPAPKQDQNSRQLRSREIRSNVADRRRAVMAASRALLLKPAERIVKRETDDVMRNARKYLSLRSDVLFHDWLDTYYSDQGDSGYIEDDMAPALRSYADTVSTDAANEVGYDQMSGDGIDAFMTAYIAAFLARYRSNSLYQLKQVYDDAISSGQDVVEALQERCDDWMQNRAGDVANQESVQCGNAVAEVTYARAGVTKKEWKNSGSETCPYCRHLNNMVVEIDRNFVNAGDSMQIDGVDKPVQITKDRRHPPAHAGCDCVIVAVQ